MDVFYVLLFVFSLVFANYAEVNLFGVDENGKSNHTATNMTSGFQKDFNGSKGLTPVNNYELANPSQDSSISAHNESDLLLQTPDLGRRISRSNISANARYSIFADNALNSNPTTIENLRRIRREVPPLAFSNLPPGRVLKHNPKKWGDGTVNFISQPLYQSPEPKTPGIPRWMFRIDAILDMIEPIPGKYRAVHHNNGLIPEHLLPHYPCFLRYKKLEANCNCGVKLKRRIVGGHFAKEGDHPWIAGFYTTTNPIRFCGGTILNEYWIVTAAHCFMKERPLSTLRIGLGDFNVHSTDEYEHVSSVERIIEHKGFNSDTGHDDIALVKVVEPLRFNFALQPACLPYQFTNCTWTGDPVTVIGWGRTMEGFHHPSVLHEATVKVIDTQECRKKFQYVEYTNLCAHKEGTDTCQGDSGGPALMKMFGRSYLVGIVSWGVGCARPNKPGIYTSVNYYLDWIDHHIDGTPLCHI